MRFRPASINYLEDAASHHTFSTTVLNVVVQRVQDGERRDDEDSANDTDDEEPFELRSIHSGDSDDFHPYCNDDDGQITVDFGNLLQVTDNSITLPSCSIDPTKPLDITYEASNKSDTLSSTIVLRLNWYIFLNQRRQFLPKTPTSEERKCGEMKHIGTEHTDLIPLPFLQVIQAIASCPGTAITSLRCTQTKVKSHEASSTSRHFNLPIRTRHLEESASTSGRLAPQDSREDMSGMKELLTENIGLRQVNYQHEIVEIAKPSFVCDVSPYSHNSPVRSVASTTFTIASKGEDHLGDTNLDARSLFDEIPRHDSQHLSPTLPTPVDEPYSKSKRTLEHLTTDHKRASKRLCFESPPEACSNEHPSPGMQDFEFPLHDDESCVENQPVMSIEEFNTETAFSRRETKAAEKQQKKRRKEKKVKKKKKRSRREVEEELEHQLISEGNTASCLTTYGVSKITPETTRGKGKPRHVAPFFDPRVKSHNPVYKRSPFLSQVTIEQVGNAFFEARGKASQQVTARTMKVVPQRPDPRPASLQYIDHFDESRDASNDDDGLEIPHESPEPPTKRNQDEGPWEQSAAASMTAKQIRNSEESSQEVHVLCSESFIEHSSQVIASLASGSWLEETLFENFTLSNSEAQAHCRRILAHDSSLLDEVGIDIEIPGKGAIIVQKLSSWGTEEDLKDLIRRLVKLSAHGRYLQINMIICIDIEMSPASAKDIAFVQSAPLGNVDCVVSFQLVAPRSMTGAIASTILITNTPACCDVDSYVFHSIRECTAQASFLLRLVSSFTVVDALQLLCGKDGKSPRKLWQVLGSQNFNYRSGPQLRLAAQAPLNQLDA